MAAKKIEIQIVGKGGSQAAGEIRKVEEAQAELTETTKKSTASGVEDLEAQLEALKARAEALRENTQADDLDNVAKEESSARRKKEIAGAVGAIGIAAAAAGKTLGAVTDALASIDTADLGTVDAALAAQIANARALGEALRDPISALVALANGGTTIKEAFADLNTQLALNAEAQAAQIDRVIERGIVQVEAIKKLSNDLKKANALLNAKDAADAAERDNADASAIRAGADPDDVRAARAKADAEKELARINRELDEKRVGLQEKFENSNQYKVNADELAAGPAKEKANAQAEIERLKKERKELLEERENLPAFDMSRRSKINASLIQNEQSTTRNNSILDAPEDPKVRAGIEAAKKKAEEAAAEFQRQKDEIAQAEAIAREQRRTVRANAAGTVDDAAGSKASRLEAEKKADADKQRRDEEARQRAQAQAEADRARAELAAKEAALDQTAKQTAGRIFGGGTKNSTARGVATALENGTNEAEIANLTRQFNEQAGNMGAAMVQALNEVLATMAKQANQIKKQSEQISLLSSQTRADKTNR